MKPFFVIFLAVLLMAGPFVTGVQAASKLSDGTYTINYTVLRADNDSVSIANDYWEKPATVMVKNGEMTMQMKLNHSSWITEFKVTVDGKLVDTVVKSRDQAADTRVVEFKVKDLSAPLVAKIHVTVESINYDHDYTIRFAFDPNSIKAVNPNSIKAVNTPVKDVNKNIGDKAGNPSTAPVVSKNGPSNGPSVVNPQTGDSAPIVLLVSMLLGSFLFLVRRLVT